MRNPLQDLWNRAKRKAEEAFGEHEHAESAGPSSSEEGSRSDEEGGSIDGQGEQNSDEVSSGADAAAGDASSGDEGGSSWALPTPSLAQPHCSWL